MKSDNNDHHISISKARETLPFLCKSFIKDPQQPYTITSRGEPEAVLLSYDLFSGISETLEILSDASLLKSLRESIKQANKGQLIPMSKIEAKLK